MIPEHPLGLQTWLTLARRLEEIRRAREQMAVEAEPVPELVFDEHDQATLKQ